MPVVCCGYTVVHPHRRPSRRKSWKHGTVTACMQNASQAALSGEVHLPNGDILNLELLMRNAPVSSCHPSFTSSETALVYLKCHTAKRHFIVASMLPVSHVPLLLHLQNLVNNKVRSVDQWVTTVTAIWSLSLPEINGMLSVPFFTGIFSIFLLSTA